MHYACEGTRIVSGAQSHSWDGGFPAFFPFPSKVAGVRNGHISIMTYLLKIIVEDTVLYTEQHFFIPGEKITSCEEFVCFLVSDEGYITHSHFPFFLSCQEAQSRIYSQMT